MGKGQTGQRQEEMTNLPNRPPIVPPIREVIRNDTVKRFAGCPHCGSNYSKPHKTWCRDFKPTPRG